MICPLKDISKSDINIIFHMCMYIFDLVHVIPNEVLLASDDRLNFREKLPFYCFVD